MTTEHYLHRCVGLARRGEIDTKQLPNELFFSVCYIYLSQTADIMMILPIDLFMPACLRFWFRLGASQPTRKVHHACIIYFLGVIAFAESKVTHWEGADFLTAIRVDILLKFINT